MKPNVIAVDGHEVALAGIDAMLARSGRCTLIGAFSSVEDACSFVEHGPGLRVDLVILGLRLADVSDPMLNVQRFQDLGIPVLIFSSLEDPYLVRRALSAGPAGVLEKSASAGKFNWMVLAICGGATFEGLGPGVGAAGLSPRQLEVLELYAAGESAKRVALMLGLSIETVQDYISRIRQKYALSGRPTVTKVDLFRRAQEDGYLPGPLGMWDQLLPKLN